VIDPVSDRQRKRAELGMAIGLRAEEVHRRAEALVFPEGQKSRPSDTADGDTRRRFGDR